LRNGQNKKDKSIISSFEDEGETAISEGKIAIDCSFKELDEGVGKKL
jgi:hypothetical protein